MLKGLPKYLWRCTLRVSGAPFLEVLLDTTAMVEGFSVLHIWWRQDAVQKAVESIAVAYETQLVAVFGPRLVSCLKPAP
jgi:hypothetical protein